MTGRWTDAQVPLIDEKGKATSKFFQLKPSTQVEHGAKTGLFGNIQNAQSTASMHYDPEGNVLVDELSEAEQLKMQLKAAGVSYSTFPAHQ